MPWAVYEHLLDLVYDRGLLEIEMPSDPHELLKGLARDFLTDYMKAFEIDFLSFGSMTLRRKKRRGGLECDESL